MGNQRLIHTDGIVIRRRDQGEADRILTLCTPLGKQEVIAKGVRKVRSRKAGHLELFAHARLVLARSRSSWNVVSQADTVAPHAELRGDLTQGTYARYVVELYDRFVTEGEGREGLFDLLQRTLGYLCQGQDLGLLIRAYEQRLLSLVGFRAELYHCVGELERHTCGLAPKTQGDTPLGFDPEWGGVLCRECYGAAQGKRAAIPLSPAALLLLRALQRESFAQLQERRTPPTLLAEAERAARHYITHHLERDVRSGAFLRRLRRMGGRVGP
jgi:DNA repair protein RecO (recombination protein O)